MNCIWTCLFFRKKNSKVIPFNLTNIKKLDALHKLIDAYNNTLQSESASLKLKEAYWNAFKNACDAFEVKGFFDLPTYRELANASLIGLSHADNNQSNEGLQDYFVNELTNLSERVYQQSRPLANGVAVF